MAKQLNMGDLFPEYVVQTVDGRTLHLPQDYSIGPIGSIVVADALSHIQFFKKRKAHRS